jgi:hypothetical protein
MRGEFMTRILWVAVSLWWLISSAAFGQQIRGDYVETRSADVYTGHCVANGEMGLTGNEAILGWHVQQGSWNGVKLDGLSVVAAVRAQGTLGDPDEKPYPARSVLMVDDRANPKQQAALADFARAMGGGLLAQSERVIAAPVAFEVLREGPHSHRALVRAGNFATVQTRAIGDKDHLCGNEETFYPPLTAVAHAMPAVAVTDEYQGPGLGESWTVHGKRSAFVGTFAR